GRWPRAPHGSRAAEPASNARRAGLTPIEPGSILDRLMKGERSAAIRLEAISKRFGATQALDGVSFELLPAEAHALVGENGAGKSTLVKILAGVHQPDSGRIELDGSEVPIHGPAHARELGAAVIHQEPRLFPDLSVAENVCLGRPPKTRLRRLA